MEHRDNSYIIRCLYVRDGGIQMDYMPFRTYLMYGDAVGSDECLLFTTEKTAKIIAIIIIITRKSRETLTRLF